MARRLVLGIEESVSPSDQKEAIIEDEEITSEERLNEDTEEILEAIGDSIVVLTSVAHFAGLSVEECINTAYYVIAKRKGQMHNGTFVKDSE